jgi:hypothetical protein
MTERGSHVCGERGVLPPSQHPLPELIEPAIFPRVTQPIEEPLVEVTHPQIAVLENYHKAGWMNARPGTWLRRSALERLVAAVEGLPERWGLCVFDAWRPLPLQAELYEAAYGDPGLPPGFVSEPDSDPATPPPHLTGGTVDACGDHRIALATAAVAGAASGPIEVVGAEAAAVSYPGFREQLRSVSAR